MPKKWKALLIILSLIFLLFIFLIHRYSFQHLIVIFQRILYLVRSIEIANTLA